MFLLVNNKLQTSQKLNILIRITHNSTIFILEGFKIKSKCLTK